MTLVPSPFSVDRDALEDFQDGGQRARFILKDIWSILPAENVIFSLKCFSFAVYHLRKNGSHLVSSMIDDRDITTFSVKHKTATNSYFSFLFNCKKCHSCGTTRGQEWPAGICYRQITEACRVDGCHQKWDLVC